MELIIATRNPGKRAEIDALLADGGIHCADLSMIPTEVPTIEEDATTFAGNAIKKAVVTAITTRRWCLADDSGLEVDALNGAPGVHSARYAGEPSDDHANNRKLQQALNGCNQRSARFRCVLALSAPCGKAQIVEGICEGYIAIEPRGDQGFGYDPLFIPEGYIHTMAELGPSVKQSISHRAAALRLALERWKTILEKQPTNWPARGQESIR